MLGAPSPPTQGFEATLSGSAHALPRWPETAAPVGAARLAAFLLSSVHSRCRSLELFRDQGRVHGLGSWSEVFHS